MFLGVAESLVLTQFDFLQVITTEIDEGMDDNGIVLPGIGNFGEAWPA